MRAIRKNERAIDRTISRFLHASAEQIDAASSETQAEIDGLAQLVAALAKHASGMSHRLEHLSKDLLRPEDMQSVREEIASLDAVANKTIARLHFADRLNHRLGRVQDNLDALADFFSAQPGLCRARQQQLFPAPDRPPVTARQRELFDELLPERTHSETPAADNVTVLDFAPRKE